jgi:diadenosine tetraphosphatase ApaH/serine/threonine PP2A family protein phosphatase
MWTLDVLKPAHREWLAALPEGPIDVDDVVEICHGSPFDEDAYIFDELDAVRALKVSNRPLCLFGHTHYPVTFELSADSFDSMGSASSPQTQVPMKPGRKYLINPGSVGQPRDGDPRAAYAIVDTSLRVVELYRTRYAIEDAQTKVVKAGLPDVLAQRLAVGR